MKMFNTTGSRYSVKANKDQFTDIQLSRSEKAAMFQYLEGIEKIFDGRNAYEKQARDIIGYLRSFGKCSAKQAICLASTLGDYGISFRKVLDLKIAGGQEWNPKTGFIPIKKEIVDLPWNDIIAESEKEKEQIVPVNMNNVSYHQRKETVEKVPEKKESITELLKLIDQENRKLKIGIAKVLKEHDESVAKLLIQINESI